jgi:hypothetical protein
MFHTHTHRFFFSEPMTSLPTTSHNTRFTSGKWEGRGGEVRGEGKGEEGSGRGIELTCPPSEGCKKPLV